MSLDLSKAIKEHKTVFTNILQKHAASLNAYKFKDLYADLMVIPTTLVPMFTELLLKAGINPLRYMNYIPQFYLYSSDIYIKFNSFKDFDYIEEEAFAFSDIEEININVPVIHFCAFSGCKKLKIATLPTIKSIGIGAFNGCKKLTQLWIGKSLVEIKINAFNGCNSLTDIFYEGTQED